MLKFKEKDGSLFFKFYSANLDGQACESVNEQILAKLDDAEIPIVFDLDGVVFICSLFLRICITVSKKVGKDQFSIVNVEPMVKKVFKISRMDSLFNIE